MLPRDAKGGILADDMGLGKTLVILSTIAGSLGRASDFVSKSQRKDHGTLPLVASRSTLVICPSSCKSHALDPAAVLTNIMFSAYR